MKAFKVNRVTVILPLLILAFFSTTSLFGQDESAQPLLQFLFPSFTKGIVQMKDGRKLTAILNYNMVDEEMVFQQNKLYMVLDKPEEIDSIFLQNRRFVYVKKAFYEVIVKGTVTFFIQHKSKYTQVASNTAYGMKSQTNATINVETFRGGNQVRHLDVPENVTVVSATVCWAKINGEMNKFTSERQFLKLFPEREAELKEFIKRNGADIKTREGLIQVGNFINGIN
jgi:hypothetical protein